MSASALCSACREWTDGVLTTCARKVVAEPLEQRSWIVCDGDIDPEWIEALNSVLDDNRLLTMPHGERIQFGSNVNFIFECHSLQHASPATVSRCGVIFLSGNTTGQADVRRTVTRVCASAGAESIAMHSSLVAKLIGNALEWLQGQPSALAVPVSRNGVIESALSQLYGADANSDIAALVARGLVANMVPNRVEGFLQQCGTWAGAPVAWPVARSVDPLATLAAAAVDAGESVATGDLQPDQQPAAQLVMTDELRNALTVAVPWLKAGKHFVLCGPNGCGKRTLLAAATQAMPGTSVAHFACNAETQAPHAVHKLMQVHSNHAAVTAAAHMLHMISCMHTHTHTHKNLAFSMAQRQSSKQAGHASRCVLARRALDYLHGAWCVQVCGKPVVTGDRKVLKPRGASRLVMVLHDVNLPQPDQYGTVKLIAWLHQVVAHGGFHDASLDFVSLENIQLVGVMEPESSSPGRVPLALRFSSTVHVLSLPPLSDTAARSVIYQRAATSLSSWKLAPNSVGAICDGLLHLIASFSAEFNSKLQANLSVTTAHAMSVLDAMVHYSTDSGHGSGKDHGVFFAQALCNEVVLQLRNRLGSSEQYAEFDAILQRTLLPALRLHVPPDGMLFASLGATAQQHLSTSAKLTLWQQDDLATLVRLSVVDQPTHCQAHHTCTLIKEQLHQKRAMIRSTWVPVMRVLDAGR